MHGRKVKNAVGRDCTRITQTNKNSIVERVSIIKIRLTLGKMQKKSM